LTPEGGENLLARQTVQEALLKMPIIRGQGGATRPQEWNIVGTGIYASIIRDKAQDFEDITVKEQFSMEEQWERWIDILKPEFVIFIRKARFIDYKCPGCLSTI